jgi:hypothetical protein
MGSLRPDTVIGYAGLVSDHASPVIDQLSESIADTVSAEADPVSDYAGNRLQSVIHRVGPVSDHANPLIDHYALSGEL